ncbi:MAG: patatin-like phospholipase family protein [Prevotella sp.]|nr:patatin-like phospholipase family protein [Prevotella sp.]
MSDLLRILRKIICGPKESRNVALVLSGGGARGYAHIGAIEALLEQGYNITSVAGTSMGALVGGIFAAGKLPQLKEQILQLDRKKVLSLLDISLGLDHVASGERLMGLMESLTGDETIENLPISFCCSATDIVTGSERVFRYGSLRDAIRASISIPCFFKPVSEGNHIYVDGSVHNTLPLDRVSRQDGDILVAVNVSAPDDEPYTAYLKHTAPRNDTERTLRSRLPFYHLKFSENYMSMALRVARIAVQNNTQMALRLTPPDIYAEIPMNTFSLFDFHRGQEIITYGYNVMRQQLEAFKGLRS